MMPRPHVRPNHDLRPLIAHVVYRFDIGGLENGVVNLINHLAADAYRHAIVSLTEITDFRDRISGRDVIWIPLHKTPGHGYRLFPRLFRLFRELAPAIVHTRNLAALEATFPAWLAGVPARVHGEHGWDIGDLDGTKRAYQWTRRCYRPFVSRYVALSKDLERYLCGSVGVPKERVVQIYNGVDTARFAPSSGARGAIAGCPFGDPDLWLVGTVGRLQAVKDQLTLAHAFVRAFRQEPTGRQMRLVIAGEGPLRSEVERVLDAAGVRQFAWLPGERADVAEILRGLDCFVLPSLAEGVSNTVLEAMACGIPVVATRVGGNPELIDDGVTGRLIAAASGEIMAEAIAEYLRDPALARRHGAAARQTAIQRFGLDRMIDSYRCLYDELIAHGDVVPTRAGARG